MMTLPGDLARVSGQLSLRVESVLTDAKVAKPIA